MVVLSPMIFFIICVTFALKNVHDDNLIVSKRRLYIERENKVEIGPVILQKKIFKFWLFCNYLLSGSGEENENVKSL